MAQIELLTAEIEGVEEIKKALGPCAFDSIVADALEEVARKARTVVQGSTPVYRPQKGENVSHQPGLLKKSWTKPKQAGPKLFTFRNAALYADIVQMGLYKPEMVVGQRADGTPGRLVQAEGGVYSKQAVGGMTKVLEDEAFLKSIATLVAQRIRKGIDQEMAKRDK